jgi:DNA polymerase
VTYTELLTATIRHLEELQSRGVRHVVVAPQTLQALAQPARTVVSVPPAAAPAVSPQWTPIPAAAPIVEARPAAVNLSVPAPAAPVRSPAEKAAAFAELRQRALACVKCPHLVAARKSVVFGVGNLDAALMFVGEAPGADEDVQGEPFVGRAGELLTKIIQAT